MRLTKLYKHQHQDINSLIHYLACPQNAVLLLLSGLFTARGAQRGRDVLQPEALTRRCCKQEPSGLLVSVV